VRKTSIAAIALIAAVALASGVAWAAPANVVSNRLALTVTVSAGGGLPPGPPPVVVVPAEPPPGGPVSFPDVPGHWAEEEILSLAEKGVLGGYPDGTFRPDVPVTRGEAAAALARAFDLAEKSPAGFPDVAGEWSEGAVSAARMAGLVEGYPDGTFRPGAGILRSELALMATRSVDAGLSSLGESAEERFGDEPFPAWCAGAIASSSRLGVFRGYPDGTFRPGAGVTRAEFAVVLHRLLGGSN
jgi:hypothetical protein